MSDFFEIGHVNVVSGTCRDMSANVRRRGHQCFCSEIGHVNVLVSCVQRTFLETMFNAIIIFIIIIMFEKLIYYQ